MTRTFLLSLCLFLLTATFAHSRDRIRIVGSQEVLPIIETVARTFSVKSELPTPALEVTGSGYGFRLFCDGIGFEYPDINITPRKITEAEFNICKKNGVAAITEIKFGRDAIVVANSRDGEIFDFTPPTLFAALAANRLKDGSVVKNTRSNWREIDPAFSDDPIRIIAPPAASGTYDDFMRLVMVPGCRVTPGQDTLNMTERFAFCHSLRTDDALIASPRSEYTVLDWLQTHTKAFAVTRYSFLLENRDLIAGNKINGIHPTEETIQNGSYPLTRSLYVYVKTKHVSAVNGLQKFLYELTNDRTIGPEGYLMSQSEQGFVPLNDMGRNHARDMALSLAPFTR